MTGDRSRATGPLAIGVDIGGTKVNALRVTGSGSVLARTTLPTPEDAERPIDVLVEAARSVVDDGVAVIGVGAAGLLERETGVMRFAPNIAWREVADPRHGPPVARSPHARGERLHHRHLR